MEEMGFSLWVGGVPKGSQAVHSSEVFCFLQRMWNQAG